MKLLKVLTWIQGLYILITAVWPLLDIHSFMSVTGPKTDVWLVKTVAALLIPIALTMLAQERLHADHRLLALLGGGTATAFIWIDFYYALNDVISNIYLADGVVEIAFLCGWLYSLIRGSKK
jgi:hypothetical protein